MIKEYFESLKTKRKVRQHLRGYEYACGCLISRSKTIEQLQNEVDTAKTFCTMDDFDYGVLDAIEDLSFYCELRELTKAKDELNKINHP